MSVLVVDGRASRRCGSCLGAVRFRLRERKRLIRDVVTISPVDHHPAGFNAGVFDLRFVFDPGVG
jgi:hypothetical protein